MITELSKKAQNEMKQLAPDLTCSEANAHKYDLILEEVCQIEFEIAFFFILCMWERNAI